MKKNKIILPVFIALFFLAGSFMQKKKIITVDEDKWNGTISNVEGATLADSIRTAAIVNNGFRASNLSVYEVRFTFTGYTSFFGTPSDCPIRSNGKVVLTGLLEGAENVPADKNITYRGTLQLNIDMDICSVKGEGDNTKACGMTVTGSGPVKTELQIYSDGRGGYIQITDTTSAGFSKNVTGSCDADQVNEERKMVPLRTIASVFNGLALPSLKTRTLRVRQYVDTGDAGETVVEVLRVVRP